MPKSTLPNPVEFRQQMIEVARGQESDIVVAEVMAILIGNGFTTGTLLDFDEKCAWRFDRQQKNHPSERTDRCLRRRLYTA